MVKIIYSMGYSTLAIGESTPLDNKFLVLHGEGNNTMGSPELAISPLAFVKSNNILNLTNVEVQTALTAKGKDFGPFLFPPRNFPLAQTATLFKIAPVPAYLVLNGLEQELNAVLVYEQLLACSDTSDILKHAKSFLCLALIGLYQTADKKPYLPCADWLLTIPAQAKVWQKMQLSNMFPSIFPPLKKLT